MRSWLGKDHLYHPLAVPVVLVAVILAIYFPAVHGGIHTIDDPGIFSLFSTNTPLSHILLPGNGYYYRPVLELTFWLDNLLWRMEPSVMHLENILLHCVNSMLVYLLARRIFRDSSSSPSIPFLVALLFAVQPVNVETVAWIAGRTDPLLALFILSSIWFLLLWLDKPSWQHMVASLALFSGALLTKETALAAGLVVFLLIMSWPGTATRKQRFTLAGIAVMSSLLLIAVAMVSHGGFSGLGNFLSGTGLQIGQGIWNSFIALGFYAKKLFVPVPLNFAITEVHPLYGMAGILLLPALWLAFCRNRQMGALFISAALMILPAIAIAVVQVAWTPFAERYLYMPSAFFAMGLSVLIQSGSKHFREALMAFVLIAAVGFTFISGQRVMLWNNKIGFVRDTISKSPGFGSLYNELGALLLQRDEIDSAADAFAVADRLNKRPSMRLPIKASIMMVQYAKGNYGTVRELFFQLFKEKKDAPDDFLELLYKSDSKRMNVLNGKDKIHLAEDVLETLDLLHQKQNDPFWLYRSGQLSLITGNKAQAADFFKRSFMAAPIDAHYRGAAETYIRRLGNTQ